MLVPWLFSLLVASAAQAQDELRVLWRDVRAPAESATDLVFLPDGFREEERDSFEASVREALAALERHPASFVRRESWNYHVAFEPSAEACPARPGEAARDTAFATHVAAAAEGGMMESDDPAIAAAAREVAPGVDCVIVVVRAQGRIGFATGDLPLEGARVRLPQGMEGVLLHELGHSLYSLGDEYAAQARALPACERTVVPFYPNVSLDPSGARFAPPGGVPPPVVEGALDFKREVFRPKGACVMQDPGCDRFCPACAAVIRAGRPAAPPAGAPRLELVARASPDAPWQAEVRPAASEGTIRSFAVLFRLEQETSEAELAPRFQAAHARVSRKTRYMESSWIGDGSAPGERVFSLEGQVARFDLGALEPGAYALVAASGNLVGLSPAASVRFTVEAQGSSAR